jgi:uncharacterized membrane protein YgdD (TMEM256/DUF423 family)
MSYQWQCIVGGLSGAISVGTSAYGAHGLKSSSTKDKEMVNYVKTFDTGARLHMLHSILLTATPAICTAARPRAAIVSGAFFTAGIVLFSGSCYMVGVTENRKYGKAAPIGGLCLMAGWLSLGLIRL